MKYAYVFCFAGSPFLTKVEDTLCDTNLNFLKINLIKLIYLSFFNDTRRLVGSDGTPNTNLSERHYKASQHFQSKPRAKTSILHKVPNFLLGVPNQIITE